MAVICDYSSVPQIKAALILTLTNTLSHYIYTILYIVLRCDYYILVFSIFVHVHSKHIYCAHFQVQNAVLGPVHLRPLPLNTRLTLIGQLAHV